MPAPGSTSRSDLQALERFVVESDELAELEAYIGRFNIFDALGVARAEIRHSNCLAWLLNSSESHGLGDLFLRAVLTDLLRSAPPGLRPFSAVELHGTQLRGVEVRREWRHIDILVTCKDPPFVLAVENKVDSDEHGDQLLRYEKEVLAAYPTDRAMFVFLTKDAAAPSSERWLPYGYADVHRVLDRCRQANHSSIGQDVGVFLDHYLGLIGSRFMDDPKIDELCRRIYRQHRRALELIYERAGAPVAELVECVEDVVRGQGDRWHVVYRMPNELSFVPASWLTVFPPIGTDPRGDPRAWVRLGFLCGGKRSDNRVTFLAYGWPTSDAGLRRRAIEHLLATGMFAVQQRTLTEQWTRLTWEQVYSWQEGEEPDREAVQAAVAAKLEDAWRRFAAVPGVLTAVFREHSSAP